MTVHSATCSCGQLQVACKADPIRISICHCLACQRRTGSVFSTNARFSRDSVEVSGKFRTYKRTADSGNSLNFHFCPDCGSTVYWELERFPEVIAVAIGAFANPNFPSPHISVHEATRHTWVPVPAMTNIVKHEF